MLVQHFGSSEPGSGDGLRASSEKEELDLHLKIMRATNNSLHLPVIDSMTTFQGGQTASLVYSCHGSALNPPRLPPNLVCSQGQLLRGDWIMGTLYSSVERPLMSS